MVDAVNFLKENFDFIKNNSIEGCPSILVWLPEKSYIQKTYGNRMDCPWKLLLGKRTTWNQLEVVLRLSYRFISAVFSPDSMYILSASEDNVIRIWDVATGECEAELKGHSDRINSAVFSPDGVHIVSASSDKTARI